MLEFAIGEVVFKIALPKNLQLKYGGHRQAVKASDCGSDMRGFESHCPPHKKTPIKGVFFVWGLS